MRRYYKQLILRDFGLKAQEKLLQANVLVIGAGGLGCPALQYLACSGVGKIGIVDGERVSVEDLHRQGLFSEFNLGQNKAQAAKAKLCSLNAQITIDAVPQFFSRENGAALIRQYDYIIDATNNLETKYLINDLAGRYRKALIYGAVCEYEGQIAILNVKDEQGVKASLNHLFPQGFEQEVTDQANGPEGVLAVLSGIIGLYLAAEFIKLITGLGEPLINRLMIYNVLTNRFDIVHIVESSKARLNDSKKTTNQAVFNLRQGRLPILPKQVLRQIN